MTRIGPNLPDTGRTGPAKGTDTSTITEAVTEMADVLEGKTPNLNLEGDTKSEALKGGKGGGSSLRLHAHGEAGRAEHHRHTRIHDVRSERHEAPRPVVRSRAS